MKPNLITSNSFRASTSLTTNNPIPFLRTSTPLPIHSISLAHRYLKHSRFVPICFSNRATQSNPIEQLSFDSNQALAEEELGKILNVQVGNSKIPSFIQPSTALSLSDQALFLLSFIALTTSVALTGFIIAAIPTLSAMRRTAISLSKLADTAREELPSTMAALRLSGMEISDLTLELSDLSHEITDGVNKSAQAVQAAEAGIRHIGTVAQQHTISMIQERADLPVISLQPIVVGAAKKTSHAVVQATKTLMNMISRGEFRSENDGIERMDV